MTARNLFVAGFIGSPPMNFVGAATSDGEQGSRHPAGPDLASSTRPRARVRLRPRIIMGSAYDRRTYVLGAQPARPDHRDVELTRSEKLVDIAFDAGSPCSPGVNAASRGFGRRPALSRIEIRALQLFEPASGRNLALTEAGRDPRPRRALRRLAHGALLDPESARAALPTCCAHPRAGRRGRSTSDLVVSVPALSCAETQSVGVRSPACGKGGDPRAGVGATLERSDRLLARARRRRVRPGGVARARSGAGRGATTWLHGPTPRPAGLLHLARSRPCDNLIASLLAIERRRVDAGAPPARRSPGSCEPRVARRVRWSRG